MLSNILTTASSRRNGSEWTVGTASIVERSEWRELQKQHRHTLEPITGPYLSARSRGKKDPILDFLFEYYAFRPSHLLKWSPGIGRVLRGDPAELELPPEYLNLEGDCFSIDPLTFPERRLSGLEWISSLLKATTHRPPMFGCHGLHEWAMVYKMEDVRHPQFPLRLGRDGTNDVVESHALVCTHFDAFRFFTGPAVPRNRQDLTRNSCHETEQPGCLHVNMDLYKWTYKLYPWTSGELLADAFLLARDIRFVDMKASPYDLSSIGLDPIRIEESDGRGEYRALQQQFAERAVPIRNRLLSVVDLLLETAIESA